MSTTTVSYLDVSYPSLNELVKSLRSLGAKVEVRKLQDCFRILFKSLPKTINVEEILNSVNQPKAAFTIDMAAVAEEASATLADPELKSDLWANPVVHTNTTVTFERVTPALNPLVLMLPPARSKPQTLTQLRSQCTKLGIRWRNVRGKNQHLSCEEMIAAIESHKAIV